jgi:hypothetical protein
MNPRLRCHSALLTTAAAGVIVVTLALGAGPAFADTSATAATTPAATATPSTRWSSTAGAMPVDTGTEMDSLPSYGASSPTTPIVLGAVQAGAPFSYDLRPTNATGATYTLTSTDGSPATLDPTTSFVGGVLSGSATTAGTFLAQVTATTPYGTTSEWVTDTVTAGPAKSVDVEASRAWSGGSPSQMTGSGSTSIGQGGSLVLAAWTEDGFGNRSDSTARAIVTSNDPSDVIVDGSSGWVVSFPDASTHVVTVAVDSVSTSFTVAVTPTATAAPDRTGSAATPSITTGPTSSGGVRVRRGHLHLHLPFRDDHRNGAGRRSHPRAGNGARDHRCQHRPGVRLHARVHGVRNLGSACLGARTPGRWRSGDRPPVPSSPSALRGLIGWIG